MPPDDSFPGVFIDEQNSFPNPVVPVATGIAAFIGGTAQAMDRDGKDLTGVPTRIGSHLDYQQIFGGSVGLGRAVELFYANGGGDAVVVSVGTGGGQPSLAAFRSGLAALEADMNSAIVVAPQSVGLSREDHYRLAAELIGHCAAKRSRMAIVDVHGGDDPANASPAAGDALVRQFRVEMASVPAEARRYGASYFPFLVAGGERIAPAAVMAGIWARVDAESGAWEAPANVAPLQIDGLAFEVDDRLSGSWSVDALGGLSVNPIRTFTGMGTLVWGARTLDGNSDDFRYIPVSRTLIWIEQSARLAIEPYVFQPNAPATWGSVRVMIEAFLDQVWRWGGLIGATPRDAFAVTCGLGTSMTAEDVAAGVLRVTMLVAVLRPAEFMPITLEIKLAGG